MGGLTVALRRLWTRLRYNDYTVCDYFRSQGARIGERTRILIRDIGSEPYLVSIGDDTLISSDVALFTHDGAVWVLRHSDPQVNRFGRIRIGSRCFIGARTTMLPGTSVGDDSVIGAGSVVTGHIPNGVVAAGVPARVIRTVEDWAADVRRDSIELPSELFPLNSADRGVLREWLERSVPAIDEATTS